MNKLSLLFILVHLSLFASHHVTPDKIRRYCRDFLQETRNVLEVSRLYQNQSVDERASRLVLRLSEYAQHIKDHEPYEWSAREQFGLVSIEYNNLLYFLQHHDVEDSIRDVFNRLASPYGELSNYYAYPFFPGF